MGLSSCKLYGGNKATNTKNQTVNLYESLSDVQNQGYKVVNNGQVLYAKYGEVNAPNASKIRVKIGGIEKSLLNSAENRRFEFIDNFDDRIEFSLDDDDGGKSYALGKGRYKLVSYIKANDDTNHDGVRGYALGELKIPKNAINIKLQFSILSKNGNAYWMYWGNSTSVDERKVSLGDKTILLKQADLTGRFTIRVREGSVNNGSYQEASMVISTVTLSYEIPW